MERVVVMGEEWGRVVIIMRSRAGLLRVLRRVIRVIRGLVPSLGRSEVK
jgi:hypothetical protein